MKFFGEYELRSSSLMFWDMLYQIFSFIVVFFLYSSLLQNPNSGNNFLSAQNGFLVSMFPFSIFWGISHIANLYNWKKVILFSLTDSKQQILKPEIEWTRKLKITLLSFISFFALFLIYSRNIGFIVGGVILGVFTICEICLFVFTMINSIYFSLKILIREKVCPIIYLIRIFHIVSAVLLLVVAPVLSLVPEKFYFGFFPIFVGLYSLITVVDYWTFVVRNRLQMV
jgi:hypothetical protein